MKFPVPMLLGIAYGLSEAGLGILKRSRDDSVDADDSSLRVLWVTIVLAVTAGIVASYREPGAAIANRTVFWVGCALFGLGLALRLANWWSLALIMVPILWAFGRRMAVEETALASALGAPYTSYMSRTKRLAPFIY